MGKNVRKPQGGFFGLTLYNPIHSLRRLLSSERSTPYLTRSRVHGLSPQNSSIDKCSFI